MATETDRLREEINQTAVSLARLKPYETAAHMFTGAAIAEHLRSVLALVEQDRAELRRLSDAVETLTRGQELILKDKNAGPTIMTTRASCVFVLFRETNTGRASEESDGYVESIFWTEAEANAAKLDAIREARDKGEAIYHDPDTGKTNDDWTVDYRVEAHQIIGKRPTDEAPLSSLDALSVALWLNAERDADSGGAPGAAARAILRRMLRRFYGDLADYNQSKS